MKLFNTQPKCCRLCIHSVAGEKQDEMFCAYRGVMPANDGCRKFKYDVLKRKPVRIKPSGNYKAEDFKL